MISALQNRYNTLFDATLGKLWIARVWNGIDRTIPAGRRPLVRADILLALAFGVLGAAISLWAFSQTNRVAELHTTFNLWLHADAPRVAENMVTTSGDHGRTSVHPVFSILIFPFGGLLTALGMEPLAAAKSLIIVMMGVNAALFSLTIRLLGLPRIAVALFTTLFMATASFLFWGALVESFPFSCFGVLISLFMMFRVKTAHWAWWIAVNVLSIGFLVTNWMFGLIAMAVRLKLKPFVTIAAASFVLTVMLSVLQNTSFEKAAIFINPHTLTREANYFQPAMEEKGIYEEGWRPLNNLRSTYVTTVVAMPVYIQQQTHMRLATTNQNSSFPEGELSPVIAVIAWVLLFGLGLWGAVLRKDLRLPLIGAGAALVLQTLLHLIYGEVTFLYSMSFMPLLILFASCSWFSPYRTVSIVAAGLVLVFGVINNTSRFQETIDVADCLADVDSVKALQTWDYIRANNGPELTDYDGLQVDTVDLCGTKTPR
ncbi:hypothetical protein WNY37_14355 [Henriciella sp. AS95]|uniref:hypothetical protein n=1 Tax=Henriciella sp. AS95 TaxID=3135782 RepID=UPI00316B3BF9